MNYDWIRPVAAVVGGGAVGVALGLGLDAWLGDEMVALAAVRTIGWFLLGVASGRWGSRLPQLRLAMVVLAVTGLTSWTSLALHGVTMSGQVLVAFIEVAISAVFALMGHLLSMPKGPDLR